MESYTGKYLLTSIYTPLSVPEDRFRVLATFPLKSDDLFIVTFPKSGTTWTQQIVRLLRNNGTQDTSGVHISTAIPYIDIPKFDQTIKEMRSPRTIKTHANYEIMPGGEPAKSPAKYIYIARNPKDVAVSLYYHARAMKHFEFTGDWNVFFDYFISGKCERGSWFDHVLEWWKHRDCNNILFLKYEDRINDPIGNIKKISQFIDVHLEDSVLQGIADSCSFQKMKSDPLLNTGCDPLLNTGWPVHNRVDGEEPFFRKGIIGDWRNHFNTEQCRRFDEIYERKMKDTSLNFTFY